MTSTIPDTRVDKLIKLLVDEPKVTISSAEIKKMEAKLREVNLPHRADLIKYLKRKSTTYQRWQQTKDISELEQEADNLEQNSELSPGVLGTLYEMILRKATQNHDTPVIVRTLPKYYQKEKQMTSNDVKIYKQHIQFAHNIAFLEMLNKEAWTEADQLWTMKPSKNPEHALLYALSFCRRNHPEEAHEILKSVKTSAVNLQIYNFNSVSEEMVEVWFMKLMAKRDRLRKVIKTLMKV